VVNTMARVWQPPVCLVLPSSYGARASARFHLPLERFEGVGLFQTVEPEPFPFPLSLPSASCSLQAGVILPAPKPAANPGTTSFMFHALRIKQGGRRQQHFLHLACHSYYCKPLGPICRSASISPSLLTVASKVAAASREGRNRRVLGVSYHTTLLAMLSSKRHTRLT